MHNYREGQELDHVPTQESCVAGSQAIVAKQKELVCPKCEKEMNESTKDQSDKDELYATAVEIIKTEGKASTSFFEEHPTSMKIFLREGACSVFGSLTCIAGHPNTPFTTPFSVWILTRFDGAIWWSEPPFLIT